MLSNAQSKYIRSLSQQKYRKQYKVFLAEGDKIAREWLATAGPIQMIVATEDWAEENKQLIHGHSEAELCIVTADELERVSVLQAAHKALLVVPYPPIAAELPTSGWSIVTERVQDPGNLGTIIRIADWFGVQHVVCSPDCADFYNPKVVQAAMGGHLRVQLHVTELVPFVRDTDLTTIAATLGGTSIYEIEKPDSGILMIGNESKGLSDEILQCADMKVTIPRLGGAESLNAGVSAGILTAFLAGR
ncbi:MAG: RNA methyltransferase [Chitinophagaceae bacterium]|nr:RNA methyltransferase [Chitinophagaceae bacterium]MCB9045754.1 RNA methyltransferase [Chitinophagales bacterium]